MELAHQLYVSIGLGQAAELAEVLGHKEDAQRWKSESLRLRNALLADDRFALIEDGCLIKRRLVDGEVQREVVASTDAGLPEGIPLFEDGPHLLDPDTSTLYPITLEFIDPKSKLARTTLDAIEPLWNQTWEDGGYSRYNVTSEAGAAAPWPITSMIVAQAAFEVGLDERVWRVLRWMGETPGARAGAWLEFFGWWPAPPYPQVGVIPWTWAEVLRFFVHHLLGVRPKLDRLELRPRLLEGQARMQTSIRIREYVVHLSVRRALEGEEASYRVNGHPHSYNAEGLRLPVPTQDLDVEAVLPD